MRDPRVGQAVAQRCKVMRGHGFVGDDDGLPAPQQWRDFAPGGFEQLRSNMDFVRAVAELDA